MIENVDTFRKSRSIVEKKPISEVEKAKIVIRASGVYKFE